MVEKKEDKFSRAITYIANMDDYEETLITPFGKNIDTHHDTAEGIIDLFEAVQDSGRIAVSRNNEKKIIRFVKLPDIKSEIEFKEQMRDIMNNINKRLDSIEEQNKKILKNTKLNLT